MKPTNQQQGFVLITALILVSVLSLLGVMALRGSLFEERMASNDRDRALAREFAEMALRDAERDILGLRFDGTWCTGVCGTVRPSGTRPKAAADGNFWNVESATNPQAAFTDGGLSQASDSFKGVYSFDAAIACGKPVWQGADWGDTRAPARTCAGTINAAVPTVQYGSFTDAPFNGPNGMTAPRYLIEMFPGQAVISSSSTKVFFRITAVGYGRTSGPTGRTSVTLQSVFSPD